MNDSLGDRIKSYEHSFTYTFLKRTPLFIRVDGKSFHTYTKGFNRPFDEKIMNSMILAAKYTAEQMQGFKIAYVQSDEATFFLTDYDKLESQGWFGYELNKIVSVSASLMTAHFNMCMAGGITDKLAFFDSRAFCVPMDDIANAFLWRAQDWKRNSLQMYCRSLFSHKELNHKNSADMHEMLHKIGKNWTTDLNDKEKNGTFIVNGEYGFSLHHNIQPDFESINNIVTASLQKNQATK